MNKVYFTKFLTIITIIITIFNIFALNAQSRKYTQKELLYFAQRNFSTKIYLDDNSELTYYILNKEFERAWNLISIYNANVDQKNIKGITPLMVASKMNAKDLIDPIVLNSKYFDLETKKYINCTKTHDNDGQSAYDHAMLNENYEFANILKNKYGITSGIGLD
ncbi:MAG: hypothetical protein SZ59_C0006G0022 [candidate division TM6 bacterium GW2011_GWF2_28_16]|jgi:ankyrin repeat protein|nr:MAG: hypothetical protein SZ59_C0006G0022 [candidate division TM6 bacterium GW2011_GWF2_28_16]